jgi:hypothetical protein
LKPPILIARALLFLLQKRIRYEKGVIGKISSEYEDDEYEIFRNIILDPEKGQHEKPGAIFRVNGAARITLEGWNVK